MTDDRKMQVRSLASYLDSPKQKMGVKIGGSCDDKGWLSVEIKTDESIVGWALKFNGKDHPTTDDALRSRVTLLEGALRYFTGFGGEAGRHARETLGEPT